MTQARIDAVVVRAPAKINLCLHVGTRRPNGYHDLESLVVFAEIGDELRLEHSDRLSLAIAGPFAAALPVSDDNLVVKAARLLAARTGSTAGAHITLTKRIPIASGIGGGSADAAATLRGLARLWQLDLARDALSEPALELGADVPMCLASTPSWVEGRGERICPMERFPDCALVLANPMVEVSTAKAFAKLVERTGLGGKRPPADVKDVYVLADYLRLTANDLELPAIEIAPVIAEVLREMRGLPGVLLARMSGSGATSFGLFSDRKQAEIAAASLAKAHPGWWVVGTGLAGAEMSAARLPAA